MRRLIAIVMVLVMLLLSGYALMGCNISGDPGEGDYEIFYYDSTNNEVIASLRDINIVSDSSSAGKTELAYALYEEMQEPQGEGVVSIIPKELEFDGFVIEGNVLSMYFGTEYMLMDNVTEILFRAAVVKTMDQISGIDYIKFFIGENPLTNAQGQAIGLMRAQDYIVEISDILLNINTQDVTVYYSNLSGDRLVGETKKIAYSAQKSIEQAIIEQLISGPDSEDCIASLPSNLKLIDVTTRNGVAYVNFDGAFLDSLVNVSSAVSFYSVVNTLCSLPNIRHVQILVNGSSDYVFRENFNLAEIYDRNLDIIESEISIEKE